MIQIAYVSNAMPSLDAGEVFKIIETSAANNLRDDLTGLLIFSGGRFFQIVEGPQDRIEALFDRLATDNRHDGLKVLSRTQIEERSFPKWQMKRVRPEAQPLAGAGSDPALSDMPGNLRQLAADFIGASVH